MSTPILICACITALLLIFELSRIVAALSNIRETLDIIHRDLVMLFMSPIDTLAQMAHGRFA